jgi:transposase-like protein
MASTVLPETLQEAVLYFADYENCHKFMADLRWPNGKVACPRCGSESVAYLAKARVYKCYAKHERPKFSLKVGTIFEDSPIGLEKWLPVVWMIVNAKNGVSSWEIHRAIGVTQKTAWFLLHRARLAMQDDRSGGKLGGEVEIDETFIGGKARNMHKNRKERALEGKGGGYSHKIGMHGMLQRGGKVRAVVISHTTHGSLMPNISENVEKGATVYTDELRTYLYGW